MKIKASVTQLEKVHSRQKHLSHYNLVIKHKSMFEKYKLKVQTEAEKNCPYKLEPMKEHIDVERIEAEIQTIAELKAEHEFGSAEYFQRELVHNVKVAKRVNLNKLNEENN